MAKDLNNENDLREYAKKSLKRKRDAWQFLYVTIFVNILMNAIWWFTSPSGYYWPIWVIFGMGIGVITSFYDAYFKPMNRPITDDDIDSEVAKLKQRRR